MKIKLLFCLLLGACTNINQSSFNEKSLLDLNDLHCPKNKILYCEGRNRHTMDCQCVDNRFISNVIPVFR